MHTNNRLIVSIAIIMTMLMSIFSIGLDIDNSLEDDVSANFVVTDGPTLSSPDGIPGYPITITADVSGIVSNVNTWYDDWYIYSGFEPSGTGVFDCGESFDYDELLLNGGFTGYDGYTDHVIPLDWVEDGYSDCYNGADEEIGAYQPASSGQVEAEYRIWAVSSTGEEYLIKSGISAIDGEISANWDVPEIQPTGSYDICVEAITEGGQEWDMGLYSYVSSWSSHIRAYRNLVEINSISSTDCAGFELNLYDISLISENNVVIPGSTVNVNGFVSNPITGAPSDPGYLEASLRYFTENDEGVVLQNQEIYISENTALFDFAFLLPSNLYQGSNTYFKQVFVDVWANSSVTNQFELETITLRAGVVSSNILEPMNADLVYRDEPFIFQSETFVTDDYWFEPFTGHELTLEIRTSENGITNTEVIFSEVETDRSGGVFQLINLSGTDISGIAEMVLWWNNPATMETDSEEITIFVADSTYIKNNLGQGLNLDVEVVGEYSGEGEDVTFSVTATDDWGTPISSIYILHYLELEFQFEGGNSNEMVEQFGYSITDQNGQALVTISIPSGLNGANTDFVVVGFNETGFADSTKFEVELPEPEIDVQISGDYYVPGQQTTLYFNCTNLKGEVTYFWETSSEESGFVTADSCDSTAMVEFIIPMSQDSMFYGVMVAAIGEQGVVTDSFVFPIYIEEVEIDIILQTTGTHLAGDNVTVQYNITIDDNNMSDYFPLSWEVQIAGFSPYDFENVINESVGNLTIMLPDSLSSGPHIVSFQFWFTDSISMQAITVVEVVSQVENQEQEEMKASLSYKLENQATIIALISLFVALSSLLYMAISKPKNGSSDNSIPSDFLVKPDPMKLETPIAMPIAPEPSNNLPPPDAVGTISGGQEWVVHFGKNYYRPVGSNDEWKMWED